MTTLHRNQRIFAAATSLLFLVCASAGESKPLSGQWRLELDQADAGIREQWFKRTLKGKIMLPGTLSGQNLGDSVTTNTTWTGSIVDRSWFTASEYAKYRQAGNVKVPFWLTPERYYAGAAWYQREIEVPQAWEGQHVNLFLERPHWETQVWLDDEPAGTNNGLATPHEFDLGELTPGKHTLTIRIDNRTVVPIGENSHSISDHTQGNWNGIVGKIELHPKPPVRIDRLDVFPEIANKTVRLRITMENLTGTHVDAQLRWTIWNGTGSGKKRWSESPAVKAVAISGKAATAEVTCEIPASAGLWDEFTPNLHRAEVELVPLNNGGDVAAARAKHVSRQAATFGLRDIAVEGTRFLLNGKGIFIRGTLDCAGYPLTGHPPTDVESWKRVIRTAKAHGLNEIRFHSWCPPEAAFTAADELGFYFHVEASSWANDRQTWLGDGKPVDAWIYAETDRILRYYGNHPSFLLMVYGNEPGGKNHKRYLAEWVRHYKARDRRRLWSSGAGWPELPENQWHNIPEPRIQGWGEGLKSRINAHAPETASDYRANIGRRTAPIVSHEIGQWCVYPNFAEIKKYKGYLKARNFEVFRDFLAEHGLADLGRRFFLASGELQAICYKEEIESALRTPGMGGFELLDLHDFPGQGTALVGVLDAFWEEKGYIKPEEFKRFCDSTVLLARLKQRVFTTDEKLSAEIEISHFAPNGMERARASWKLLNTRGKAVAQGEFPETNIGAGALTSLGHVELDLEKVPAPARYKLTASISGKPFENDWDVWVYPKEPGPEQANDVLVTSTFDEAARQHVQKAGTVLLTIPGRQVRNFETARVKLGFSSIFWNTAWTARQAPTTLGILCDPKHPALAGFPTEFHSNWQWWHLVHRAGALRLDLLPQELQPIVRVIDDWFTARPLGLVLEARLGKGRMVVCGFDLTRDADDPVSRQMRASLLDYMTSDRFKPATELTVEQIESLILDPTRSRPAYIRDVKAGTEEEDCEASKVLDGDPDTIWHTPWIGSAPGFPHQIVFEFDRTKTVVGFTALPRQDGNRNGWIKDYAIFASADGLNWGEPIKEGSFSAGKAPKKVSFQKSAPARFVKFVAKSGFDDKPYASLAELEFQISD